jgi:hypothetical protein
MVRLLSQCKYHESTKGGGRVPNTAFLRTDVRGALSDKVEA